ncbi:MAG: hypothetical protein R3F60_20910 [bacterium]
MGGLDAAGAGEDRPTVAALRRLLPAGEVVLAASRIGETWHAFWVEAGHIDHAQGAEPVPTAWLARLRGVRRVHLAGAAIGSRGGSGRGPTAVPRSQRWYRWRRCPTPPCSCLGTRRGAGR